MFEKAGNKVSECMAVVFRFNDATEGREAAGGDEALDAGRERGGALGGDGEPALRGEYDGAGTEGGVGLGGADDGENVTDALAEHGLAEHEAGPGIGFFVVVGAGVARVAGAHFRHEVAEAADVRDADGEALEGQVLIELVLVPIGVAAGGVEYQQEVTVWKLDWLPDAGTYLDEEAGR